MASKVRFNADAKPSGDSDPESSTNLNPSFHSRALRGNLMGTHQDRDPLFYYEIVSVLGVGSMGSVAKVKKREAVVGGSARKDLQLHFRKEKQMHECFKLPLIGGIFQFCLKGFLDFKPSDSDHGNGLHDSARSSESLNRSIIAGGHDAKENFNDGHAAKDDNNMLFAMKSIHLSRVTDDSFVQELRNEIDILKTLDHPHIVKAIETFEHRNQIFIIMELGWGGDLYARDPYTEPEAARILSSILSAISYMHSRGICHRDLKYENILFANTSPKAEIKLIDFGLSAAFGKDKLTEGVGTIYTMAPEVLKGEYTKSADLWSVGVLAFMLLSSQMPFYGRKRTHIIEQIIAGKFQFKGRRWKNISQTAKDFVRDLLVVDPDDRVTAEEALSASWLNRRNTATVRDPFQEELDAAHQSMIKYSKYSKLKKVALMVIAHKSTSEEIGILRKVFQKYDVDRTGSLDFKKFKRAFDDAGLPADKALFDSLDLDGTGQIRYTEFVASTIEAQGPISERRLAEAFDRIDSDDTGYITVENLRDLLGNELTTSEIKAIISEADITKDGRINYDEFLAQWQDQQKDATSPLKELGNEELSHIFAAQQNLPFDDESEQSDGDDAPDPVARANFLESKENSVRKVEAAAKAEFILPPALQPVKNGVQSADV